MAVCQSHRLARFVVTSYRQYTSWQRIQTVLSDIIAGRLMRIFPSVQFVMFVFVGTGRA